MEGEESVPFCGGEWQRPFGWRRRRQRDQVERAPGQSMGTKQRSIVGRRCTGRSKEWKVKLDRSCVRTCSVDGRGEVSASSL